MSKTFSECAVVTQSMGSMMHEIVDDRRAFEENPELLVNTPSRKDDIDAATENALRIYGSGHCVPLRLGFLAARWGPPSQAAFQIYTRCSLAVLYRRAAAVGLDIPLHHGFTCLAVIY